MKAWQFGLIVFLILNAALYLILATALYDFNVVEGLATVNRMGRGFIALVVIGLNALLAFMIATDYFNQ